MASNPWQKKNPEDRCLSLFIALRWMQRPERVMMGLTENIQACLRDFLAGAASMARKRHLASTTRGFYGFCLMAQIEVQKVQEVQWVQIRLIRGRIEIHRTGFLRFLSYDQPRTGHKSVPSVAEQLSIERDLISVLSCFFI